MHRVCAGLVLLATLFVYHNAWRGELMFDDHTAITNNSSIRHLSSIGQVLSPPANSGVGGRPVANFTFALNHAFSGLRVESYRGVNLAVHLAAALCLFGLVRRTLLQPIPRAAFADNVTMIATAVAFLWAVHPVPSIAVNYLSQRTESLMALFYLLTLYCFARGAAEKSCTWAGLGIATCALGMASKEVMVTAPIAVFLYDRAFVAGSSREAWRQRKWIHLGHAATWLLLAALLTGLKQRGVGFEHGTEWKSYALTQFRAVAEYLRLCVWPHPLIFDRGVALVSTAREAAMAAALVLMLVAGSVVVFVRRPQVGFVAFGFFLVLAPTSTVVPIVFQPVAENRVYLPLASVVCLMVLFARALFPRSWLHWLALIAIAEGALTIQRNDDYRSAFAIWADTVRKRPENARAHNNLGLAIADGGRFAEAIPAYQRALELSPDDALAHSNLADAYTRVGRFEDAIAHGERALAINPESAAAHNNVGFALVRLNRLPEAVRHYEAALRIQPDLKEVRTNLGFALYKSGRIQDAIEQYRIILRQDPYFTIARQNLEQLLSLSGSPPE